MILESWLYLGESPSPFVQGRNEVYFFFTEFRILPEILIPDLKNVENFDP